MEVVAVLLRREVAHETEVLPLVGSALEDVLHKVVDVITGDHLLLVEAHLLPIELVERRRQAEDESGQVDLDEEVLRPEQVKEALHVQSVVADQHHSRVLEQSLLSHLVQHP